MRVLMLSWEYPPLLVGGLGTHVHAVATSLVALGHGVTVIAPSVGNGTAPTDSDGVRVIRVTPSVPLRLDAPIAWTTSFNDEIVRAGMSAGADYDVIHAHDWWVASAAVTLKQALKKPLVATLHATQVGLRGGSMRTPLDHHVHQLELWLAQEAKTVIVCSAHMRAEACDILDVPEAKLAMIHNGVDRKAWRAPVPAVSMMRERFSDLEPLVVYAGRLIEEKGVQDLISATALLREQFPTVGVVVAGDGPYLPTLTGNVDRLGLHGAVRFIGFLGQHDLAALFGAADCVVVPSHYEPFGLVVLEAMAAEAPVVAAATGGIVEVVDPRSTGTLFGPQQPAEIAAAVADVVQNRAAAKVKARHAARMLDVNHSWPTITARTANIYATATAVGADRSVGPVSRPAGNAVRHDVERRYP